MDARIVIAAAAVAVAVVNTAPVSAQYRAVDHWLGSITGHVDAITFDRGTIITLEDGQSYRVRADLSDALASGDRVRLHRDFVQKMTEARTTLVYYNRPSPTRVSLESNVELDAARAKCRADWPADFVMQRFCIEQQEEAFRDLRRR